MKKLFILFAIASLFNAAYSQSVGIGTNAPNASAALEVSSASKGVLLSRLTTQQRLAITKPAPGLLVYDLDKAAFYMNDGAAWYPLGVANESNLPALSHYPTDAASIKNFGNSVSISGNYALIGASYDSVNNHLKQGSAYIFAKVNGTWVQQAKLTAADGLTNDNFGSCVAIDGDYAVVSACSSFGITKGAVYVFVRNGTSWSQQAKLSPNDLVPGYQFGCSLGISGIYIIAGAYYSEVSGNQGQGAAYIFQRTLSSWALQKKLVADDGTAGDFFGQSVAISGDYAVAGAPAAKIGENSSQGAAYIFVQGGGTWTQQVKIVDYAGLQGNLFGSYVGISGDNLVCSEPTYLFIGFNTGAIILFRRSGSNWVSVSSRLIAGDISTTAGLAGPVSISGDYLIAGGVNAVYFFQRSPIYGAWSQIRKIKESAEDTGNFGNSVSINGSNCVVGNPVWVNFAFTSSGRISFINIQ